MQQEGILEQNEQDRGERGIWEKNTRFSIEKMEQFFMAKEENALRQLSYHVLHIFYYDGPRSSCMCKVFDRIFAMGKMGWYGACDFSASHFDLALSSHVFTSSLRDPQY
ncbi:hypothetical protein [Bartonella pachyuromydis]|uniref:Uncharacterized protein n=1 Tax=Bartonella pachyuromydis TaxID=931097 RepID=A0ABP8VJ88_9HYPH